MRIATRITALLLAALYCFVAMAQPKTDPKMKKPKQFEERKLGSEKMAEKKFTVPRHFFQNLYTHYNYYFNANNKLKEIVNAAKLQHKEDYSKLLPFYNYTFDATAQSSEIDSILQKCTAGILLHDLRNDWIDNLYLIMGQAYMLRKDFDSAAMTFQFINYTYSPKDKDGYDKIIGSNRSEGSNAFSIATKEKSNIAKKILSKPPSRNESFIWQIRNYTETEQYIDAASLITTLRNDPNFPPRLKEELSEVEAYNYYKQQIYDSSAHYLIKAVSLAQNRTEKARWYFLIGQMFQQTGNNKQAAEYFAKCISATTDPIMEVYARLSSIRLRKTDDPKLVQENIDELVKMARREKYETYRDIIYYAAALIELERNGYAQAETFLNKSVLYNTDNVDQRTRSFLLLSDMLYDTKAYGRSGFFYDSVNTGSLDSMIATRVTYRKPPTKSIYDQDRIIFAQDSLQKIAAMPETERNAYIRTLAKRLRKERGLKDEVDVTSTGQSVNPLDIGKGPSNLFSSSSGKDFYFYNSQQRALGFNDFKQRWGGRPNVDNWRRSAAIQQGLAQLQSNTPITDIASAADVSGAGNSKTLSGGSVLSIGDIYQPKDISFDALSSNLPVENTALSASNKSINEALLAKGKALQNNIEDIPEAIKVYEELLARLSENDMAEEVVFNLIYCYNKIGDTAKAAAMKKRLNTEFKDSDFAKRANNPALGTERANPAATEKYKGIYKEFIEGNFTKALADKKEADSVYGNTYWNPQLLYIESVYYVKERQDTAAINRLNVLSATYPTSPLADRARKMVEVLGRRQQIEDYLTKLNIVRATEDSIGSIPSTPVINTVAYTPPVKDTIPKTVAVAPPTINQDSLRAVQLAAANKARQDSIKNMQLAQQAAAKARQDSLKQATLAQQAATKARQDSLKQATLAKQAAAKASKDSAAAAMAQAKKLRDDSLKAATQAQLAAAKSAKDSLSIVQAARQKAREDSLKDAVALKLAAAKAKQDSIRDATAQKLAAAKAKQDLIQEAKAAQLAAAKLRQDSIKQAAADKLALQKAELAAKEQRRKDSIAEAIVAKKLADQRRADSLLKESLKPKTIEGFTVKAAEPQSAMILLNKVDPIYLNECVNAFNRYHTSKLGGSLSLQKAKINADYSVVIVSSPSFTNAEAAMNYINLVKPKAATDIVPWLDANKFSFFIIDAANLEQLKQSGNVEGYLKALRTSIPGKF